MAFHISHGDELHSVVIAQVMNPQNVLVRYFTGQEELLLETIDHLRIECEFRAHHLEGDDPVQIEIMDLINRAHSTTAKLGNDLVAGTELSDGFDYWSNSHACFRGAWHH